MDRICKKCGETKPIEEYRKHKGGRDGITAVCNVCLRIKQRDYYKLHKEKFAVYFKKTYLLRRNEHLEYQKIYRENNKEMVSKRRREYGLSENGKLKRKCYALKHKEQKHSSDKKYSKKYAEKIKAYKSLYYELNKNKINEIHKACRVINKDKYRKTMHKWYSQNQERIINKHRDYVNKLEDIYILQLIRECYGIDRNILKQYPELIENYKQQLKVKRLLKSKKNENNETS